LILTGQRRDEVCAVPLRELDLDGKLWVIAPSRAKNKVEHLVPLSGVALDLLVRSAPEIEGCGYLFTTNGRTAISGFSKWKKLLDVAVAEANGGTPIPHWTLHDLRRTFSSGWARLRIPTEVTERALNHTSGSFGGIAGVYNLHDYEFERRAAMEAWGRHVSSLIESARDNMVPLRAVTP